MKFCEKYTDTSYIKSDDCRKNIILKDKGSSTYKCENDKGKNIVVYLIDDGIIKSQTLAKCDYGLYNKDEDIIYFIELKGSDYDHALEQITSTINELIFKSNIDINCVNARIVLTKVRTPEIKKLFKFISLSFLYSKNRMFFSFLRAHSGLCNRKKDGNRHF